MKNLLHPASTKSLIVMVVFVPNAANAVIGTTLAIRKVGNGSKIGRIGKIAIGKFGTMVIFTRVSKSVVMVQHVFVVLVLVF